MITSMKSAHERYMSVVRSRGGGALLPCCLAIHYVSQRSILGLQATKGEGSRRAANLGPNVEKPT